MHITSLPYNYGNRTLGVEAYNFEDWLIFAKQNFRQIFTIGLTNMETPHIKLFHLMLVIHI